MRRRTFGWGVMGLLGGLAVLGLGGCGLLNPTYTYRFKMTVEVETPQGLKTGSSVYEVQAGDSGHLLPDEHARDWSVKGEAVMIDLPAGQTLFALIKTTNARREDLAQLSMGVLDPKFDNDIVESAQRISRRQGIHSPAEIAPTYTYESYAKGRPVKTEVSNYPMLMTFSDITDPASLKLVDSAVLATSFGPGVRLKRITIEITEDPVTTGIERRLVWLPKLHGSYLDGGSVGSAQNGGMHGGFFSSESFK